MEATFFVAGRHAIGSVAVADDLASDPATESLRIGSPASLVDLASALGAGRSGAVSQLRDATCQSFPIWTFAPALCQAIAALSDEALEATALAWLEGARPGEMDADLHELCTCLEDLRDAVASLDGSEETLFVLLEEKAL